MKEQGKFKELKILGFNESGEWMLNFKKLILKLNKNVETRDGNVLYAFIGGDSNEILYIGQTSMGLAKRMTGYKTPGRTQVTNKRVNGFIKEYLKSNKIKIYSFIDEDDQRNYKGFDVNIVAGLEGSVISKTKPKWNKQGNSKT
jgi:hypothetical protein